MSQDRNATLSARSVVLSTLLGTRPPVLPTRVLVKAGELFGISEGTIRTALSRMVAAAELAPDNGGYRLVAARLLERQARQVATTKAWRNKAWRFAFVAAERRPANERSDLRNAMKALRMAELREGVWLRPDNLKQPDLPEAQRAVEAQCVQAVGRLEGDDDAAMAARLWDLDAWADEAERLRERLRDDIELAPGFLLSAAVLRHLQADPLLPPELLPRAWPGPDLRAEYAEWDRAYRTLLRDWWKVPDSPV